MIINEKFANELFNLSNEIDKVLENNSLTDIQLENFLNNLEKRRYNILNEIKVFNKNTEFEYEKIKTIDNKYRAEFINNVLKIYIPEVMPSYKNLKTHTHKRILLNVSEITKKYKDLFNNEVFIYIKIFNNIKGWDIDNKFIKPISDGLILSRVIKDDNINNMFYCVKGEYSENPHTEVYVLDSENIVKYLETTLCLNMEI